MVNGWEACSGQDLRGQWGALAGRDEGDSDWWWRGDLSCRCSPLQRWSSGKDRKIKDDWLFAAPVLRSLNKVFRLWACVPLPLSSVTLNRTRSTLKNLQFPWQIPKKRTKWNLHPFQVITLILPGSGSVFLVCWHWSLNTWISVSFASLSTLLTQSWWSMNYMLN